MERLTYILDTNAVADYINGVTTTIARIKQAIRDEHLLILCQPVYYEVLRGLLKVSATRKQQIFQQEFAPLLVWTPLIDADWKQAARLWADVTARGRQFSDVDLLVAVVAVRLNGMIVSGDDDFDALTVPREDWRKV